MTFVPYPSDPPAVNALLGEHVTSVLYTYAAVAAQAKAQEVLSIGKSSLLQTNCSEPIESIEMKHVRLED
jgi:hypothetical protein